MLVAETHIKTALDGYYQKQKEKNGQKTSRVELIDDLIRIKKSRKQQNKALKQLAFSAGLFMSLTAVVAMFEWRSYDSGTVLDIGDGSETVEELLDIPITEQAPPPPPSKTIQQPNIVEVEEVEEIIEDIHIDFDIDITSDEAIQEVDYSDIEIVDAPEEEKTEQIFTHVEAPPTPKMGMQEFMKYLYANIQYPQAALNAKVQGRVFVQFTVNSDGQLTDFIVIKGIGMGCDEEAVRVLQNAEPWNAGRQRGKPVRVRMVLPINFVYRER